MAKGAFTKVWDLLERKGWCKGWNALNKGGRPVPIESPNAVSFCVGGGLLRVYKDQTDLREAKEQELWEVVKARSKFCSVVDWNDSCRTKKSTVIRLLKKLDI